MLVFPFYSSAAGNMAQELEATLKILRSVSEKVKNGEGTIGALFTDASLYEDLKGLIGGANRSNVLKFFVRQAVKSVSAKAKERISNIEGRLEACQSCPTQDRRTAERRNSNSDWMVDSDFGGQNGS